MAAELPRCVICRVTIQPGVSVAFRPDGRVLHVACPPVICPVCSSEINPDTPIRRDGDVLLHGNCWIRRARAMDRAHDGSAGIVMLIRGKLASGVLPRERAARIWGSMSGKGSECGACGERIVDEAEYELEFADGVSLVLHRVCYGIWDGERTPTARPIGGGSAPSPWTPFFDPGVARRTAGHRATFQEMRIATAEVHAAALAVCLATAQTCARSRELAGIARRLFSSVALADSRRISRVSDSSCGQGMG